MSPEAVVGILLRAIEVSALVGGPLLLAVLVTGLLVSVFQAATQINESTLTFIPKILVSFLVLMLTGPWMLQVLIDYTVRLYQDIPQLIG